MRSPGTVSGTGLLDEKRPIVKTKSSVYCVDAVVDEKNISVAYKQMSMVVISPGEKDQQRKSDCQQSDLTL